MTTDYKTQTTDLVWKKLRFLGKGANGEVFLASPARNPNALIAVKSADIDDGERYESLKQETSFLKELNGEPYIVRCFGNDVSVKNARKTYSLLLEYATEGTLDDLIESSPRTDVNRVACFTRMLLTALSRIHAHGVVHCDLKPTNILVFQTNGHLNLKIADFGESRRIVSEEEDAEIRNGKYRNRGNTYYASPESVARGQHGTASDVWSLGIIVAEMMNPSMYFYDEDEEEMEMYDQIVHRSLELERRVPYNFDEYAVDFLEKCLDRNPINRWSSQELLNHPFIIENMPFVGDDHQIKTENPIDPSSEWVSSYDLFTNRTCEDEDEDGDGELFQPLYDLFRDMTNEDLLLPYFTLP